MLSHVRRQKSNFLLSLLHFSPHSLLHCAFDQLQSIESSSPCIALICSFQKEKKNGATDSDTSKKSIFELKTETQIDGGRRISKKISCNPEIHRQRHQQMEGPEKCQRIKMEKKNRGDVKQMIRTFLASHHHPTFICSSCMRVLYYVIGLGLIDKSFNFDVFARRCVPSMDGWIDESETSCRIPEIKSFLRLPHDICVCIFSQQIYGSLTESSDNRKSFRMQIDSSRESLLPVKETTFPRNGNMNDDNFQPNIQC